MSINHNPKLTDLDLIAALLAYRGPVQRFASPKPKAKAKGDGRIVMSRVGAKPVTSKVTQGFAMRLLSDGKVIK